MEHVNKLFYFILFIKVSNWILNYCNSFVMSLPSLVMNGFPFKLHLFSKMFVIKDNRSFFIFMSTLIAIGSIFGFIKIKSFYFHLIFFEIL